MDEPNLYYDDQIGADAAKILPGEYYVTTRDMVLVTVLGSCVTACIRDRLSGIGGMNHFMLADAGPGSDSHANHSANHGAFAMEMLINNLLVLGAHRAQLEAKVFGGGNVLADKSQAETGAHNTQFALLFLATEKIPVVARDLGGDYPRKVYFFPKTGKVLVKTMHRMHNNTIVEREAQYSARLRSIPVEGEIERSA